MNQPKLFSWIVFVVIALFLLSAGYAQATAVDNPNPPETVVKLVFIHHSSGENWLADENGGLGKTLGDNNYFVSDTNYGWGPEAIGDRTDVLNWLEWFRSDNTPVFMQALYNEGETHAAYTRSLADPGGENQVVLFKSCFPNSDLQGNPEDPPAPGSDLTVGNAKYIYNELLKYFITRPDKLFIAITAPPLSDSTNAANARAFNQWLVNDWLSENQYPLKNVAVFDFYNILTGPDNHHRFINGQIEHVFTPGRNTAYYASAADDDHPSTTGNRKATAEFVPWLNVIYHRWQSSSPAQPQPAAAAIPPTIEANQPSSPQLPAGEAGMIDDFEAATPTGSTGWVGYWDETTSTHINCARESSMVHNGSSAMQVDFNVAANSWATCALIYTAPQSWSGNSGLTFYLHAAQAGLVFNIDLYSGPSENRATYLYTIEASPESVSGWIPVELRWSDFLRASWEENGGAPFTQPEQVTGMAIGFNTPPDAPNTGVIWIDDMRLVGSQAAAEQPAAGQTTSVEPASQEPTATQPPAAPPETPRRKLPCLGALILPLAMLGFVFGWKMHIPE